jgi:hypothetical protein
MPTRAVHQTEALAWLEGNPAPAGASVVTSLPDVSELPGATLEQWRAWFVDAARRVLRWLPAGGVAIFYQSDIRYRGAWIDKGYLVMRAAEHEGASVLWHKIVCRAPPGTVALGRPSYSRMIALSAEPRAPRGRPGPDGLPDAGAMSWSRAMGTTACEVACRFLADETDTRVVVDPFCGRGTVLAVANSMGFDAVGLELSAKRCRAARALQHGAPHPT